MFHVKQEGGFLCVPKCVRKRIKRFFVTRLLNRRRLTLIPGFPVAALDFKLGSSNKTPKLLRVGYLDPADLAVEHWMDFCVSSELIAWIRESHDKGLIIFDLQEIFV